MIDQPTTSYEKEMVSKDKCPRCRGSLDTGWECNDCGYDARMIALENSK
jgi:tRNA(Ile2) C34 agmatinyltransferase TiaS